MRVKYLEKNDFSGYNTRKYPEQYPQIPGTTRKYTELYPQNGASLVGGTENIEHRRLGFS